MVYCRFCQYLGIFPLELPSSQRNREEGNLTRILNDGQERKLRRMCQQGDKEDSVACRDERQALMT